MEIGVGIVAYTYPTYARHGTAAVWLLLGQWRWSSWCADDLRPTDMRAHTAWRQPKRLHRATHATAAATTTAAATATATTAAASEYKRPT